MKAEILPYMWDGRRLRKIHYSSDQGGGHAWLWVTPTRMEHQYAVGENAVANLASRLQGKLGWSIVKAVSK